MFETREQALEESRKREAIKRINDAITEANEGWIPDWLNHHQMKYSASYEYTKANWIVEKHWMTKSFLTLKYCKDCDALRKILQDYKDDFMELML